MSAPDLNRPLYTGDAALKLMSLPELRKAKGTPHVETLRVLVSNALLSAEEEPSRAVADEVRAAAREASLLARHLTKTAKLIEDAFDLAASTEGERHG